MASRHSKGDGSDDSDGGSFSTASTSEASSGSSAASSAEDSSVSGDSGAEDDDGLETPSDASSVSSDSSICSGSCSLGSSESAYKRNKRESIFLLSLIVVNNFDFVLDAVRAAKSGGGPGAPPAAEGGTSSPTQKKKGCAEKKAKKNRNGGGDYDREDALLLLEPMPVTTFFALCTACIEEGTRYQKKRGRFIRRVGKRAVLAFPICRGCVDANIELRRQQQQHTEAEESKRSIGEVKEAHCKISYGRKGIMLHLCSGCRVGFFDLLVPNFFYLFITYSIYRDRQMLPPLRQAAQWSTSSPTLPKRLAVVVVDERRNSPYSPSASADSASISTKTSKAISLKPSFSRVTWPDRGEAEEVGVVAHAGSEHFRLFSKLLMFPYIFSSD
jgi:hypothetical protein